MMKTVQALLFSLFLNTVYCLPGCDYSYPTYPCDVNSEFCNPHGSVHPTLCVCRKGYEEYEKSGNNGIKCKDIDECTTWTRTCKPSFDCVNTNGSYTCVCAEGSMEIYGTCEKCDFKVPCGLNSSYCKDKLGGCVCAKGFIPIEQQTGEELNCEGKLIVD
ncbi:adhesion G protein-coupled receptor E2-like [Liolophura sinensis]|uniref:adhesion G protein-coupled receptor E2-like n=1 Tax=Liolophura sinensis TaxID=3198878 RepID=UPI0031582182